MSGAGVGIVGVEGSLKSWYGFLLAIFEKEDGLNSLVKCLIVLGASYDRASDLVVEVESRYFQAFSFGESS